jgi:NodT family efflux transporter outer membrane factor (OMF) lipoprotein
MLIPHSIVRIPIRPTPRGAILMVAAALALGGCSVGPKYHPPQMPEARFDGSLSTGPTSAATQPAGQPTTRPVDLTRWWTSLDDPELDSIVERAVKANYNLRLAGARLQEVRSVELAVGGGVVPGLGQTTGAELSAGAGRGSGTNSARGRVSGPLHAGTNTTGLKEITHVAGFDASWELDLFGRFGSELQAADADVQAAAEFRNDVLLSVVAEVVRTYIDVRALQLRLEIARENLAGQRRTADLVTVRFKRGLTNELDVTLAERQYQTTLSQIAPLQAAIAAAQRRVAVLIGQYPETLREELERPSPMPATPPTVAAGMPVEMLRRRPDIRQAERQLAASTARIGVATADLFPRIALTGGAGVQGQGLGRTPVMNAITWSVGPTLYWPFLDFGRLDALVQAQDFRTQQRLLEYQRAVVSAVEEVDDALGNYAAQQDHLQQLGMAVSVSRKALQIATQRYNNGLTDFLNVLDAQRQLYDLEDQYAQAQASLTREFIALYKALGGGWEGYAAPAPPKPPMPALLAAGARTIGAQRP